MSTARPGRACARRSRPASATSSAIGYLRGIAAATGTSNLFSNIAFATYIVYAVRELGLSRDGDRDRLRHRQPRGAVRCRHRQPLERAVRPGPDDHRLDVPVAHPAVLLVALAPTSSPVPFLIAAGLLAGFSGVVYNINQVSFRQAITPPAMQGRMNATMRFIVWGTIPIGAILGGVIATTVSLNAAIWVGALGSFLAVVPLLITPVRTRS